MRLFIDTNIFLDILFQREDYENALSILNAISKGIYEGVVLDITLLNIDYVAKKQHSNIREFLTIVNQNFSVVGADNRDFSNALEMENSDLEDNLQYIVAKRSKCDLIISNDKSFYSQDLELLNSSEFVKNHL